MVDGEEEIKVSKRRKCKVHQIMQDCKCTNAQIRESGYESGQCSVYSDVFSGGETPCPYIRMNVVFSTLSLETSPAKP